MPWFLLLSVLLAAAPALHAGEPRWDLPPMTTWAEGDDPRTAVTIAWETPDPLPATLRWQEETADPSDDSAWERIERPPSRRHVVPLRDLQPGTAYRYDLVAPPSPALRTGRFKTAPSDPATPFRFVLHNDLQGGLNEEAARRVCAAVIRTRPDFVFSTGDLADSRYAGDFPGVLLSWRKFFEICSNELASFVFQPVTGNHDEPENPDSYWHRLLELPGDGRDYTLDIGPIRFIAVDSAEFEVPARTPWLARELQKAAADPNIRWIIPAFHRPPYSFGERGGQSIIRDHWVPLFTRYEVGLVLSGHAHTYQRLHPQDGVNYLVSGGGGGSLYAVEPQNPAVAFATSCYHAVQFTVADTNIYLQAFTDEGLPFDRAVYQAHRFVRVTPAFPERGGTCTIDYNPAGGPLANASDVHLHLGRDEFNQLLMNVPMTRDPDTGHWTHTFTVPDTPKWNLAFCFCNADQTIWHNNHRQNWQTLLQRPW